MFRLFRLFRFSYDWKENLGKDIIVTAGILCAATLIDWIFYRIGFSEANLVLVYFLSVVLVSLGTQWVYGIAASVTSVLLFNFFFIEPLYTFAVHDPEYLFTFTVMLIVALITCVLTATVKLQGERAAERERRTNVLYDMSHALLTVSGIKDAVRTALEQMHKTMPGTAVIYLKDGPALKRYAFSPIEGGSDSVVETRAERDDPVLWTLETGKISGNGSERYETLPALYLPLSGTGEIHGVFVYFPEGSGDMRSSEDRSLIETLSTQFAIALDREHIAIRHNEANLRAEQERIRTTLLRSISHDLRTPLASITGASSTLLENGRNLDEVMKEELLSGIYEESRWLSGLVDNLLSLSRIQSTNGVIRKIPEVIDDVLVSAVERIRKRLSNHELVLTEPEELLLVPMDGTLIEQVLINLIDNAIRHTPDGTKISVSAREIENSGCRSAEFTVEDNGPGITPEELATIFEPYKVGRGERKRNANGAGLGLSICRAIVEAHGGTITAENRREGGARFLFTLPASDACNSGKKGNGGNP